MKAKIFGIGASVLMILLVVAPAVSSNNLNKKICSMGDGDLEIKSCVYERVDWEPPYYVMYELNYYIKVNKDYNGPLELTFKLSDTGWTRAYTEDIVNFEADRTYTKKATILVPDNDESNFVFKQFGISAKLGDISLSADSGNIFTKFWKNEDWIATDTQKEISYIFNTKYWDVDYINPKLEYDSNLADCLIPVFDSEYTGKGQNYDLDEENATAGDFGDWDYGTVLPCLMTSHVMGFITEFLNHISDISLALIIFLAEVADWIGDVISLVTGFNTDFDNFIRVLNKFSDIDFRIPGLGILDLIKELIEAAIPLGRHFVTFLDLITPGEGKEALKQLKEEVDELLYWANLEPRPWHRTITISGDVYNVQNSKIIVKAYCRDKDDGVPCVNKGAGHHREVIPFDVSSTKNYDGDTELFKKCVLTLKEENGEKRSISSPESISFAAPGGNLDFYARFKDVDNDASQNLEINKFYNKDFFRVFLHFLSLIFPNYSSIAIRGV